ncbi:ABC transporter permease [Sphingobacterium daejeonense]|uniref:ABC transporter permease n=1 Tax=Sphingobacterium daejeonense TaxID=371142 RepID=UPI003D320C35
MAFTFSLSIAFLLIAIIYNQFNFDSHNNEKDKIFRVNTNVINPGNGNSKYATSPLALSDIIDQSFFESYLSLVPLNVGVLGETNEIINSKGYSVEGDFFNFFKVPIIEGDLNSILSDPYKIAISSQLSEKLFKEDKGIGKEIEIDKVGKFIVSGVYDPTINKSHLSSDILFSQKANNLLFIKGILDSSLKNSDNYAASYLYVKTINPTSIKEVDNALNVLNQTFKIRLNENKQKFRVELFGISLTNISPSNGFWLENSSAMEYDSIYIFIVIIIILLFLTLFNYASIMTSLGLAKSKEIGIRKILGASRKHIVWQYISESIIISSISFILGILLIPIISNFDVFQNLTVGVKYDLWIYLILFTFSILVGIIAGLIPAIAVQKFKELEMLNNVFRNKIYRTVSFRKVIIILQFTVSITLILFGYTLFRQTNFMATSDYGFIYNDILSVKVFNKKEYDILKDEMSKIPEVSSTSYISDNLGYMPSDVKDFWLEDESQKVELSIYYIDENSIKDLGLEIVDGENFSQNKAINTNSVILNQSAINTLNISGNTIDNLNSDTTIYRVRGIVKDFHFQNFKRSISPMAFVYMSEPNGYLNIKVVKGKLNVVKGMLNSNKTQNYFGRKTEPFEWNKLYFDHQKHTSSVSSILYLTITLVSISCLGLLALLIFATKQRFREVTIRKIIGASNFQIFSVLTKEFVILLALSLVFGISLGCFISLEFLKEFAYRIKIDLLFFVVPIFIFGLLCSAILLATTWKTCTEKPIRNLNEI